jgi:hypothetical protein
VGLILNELELEILDIFVFEDIGDFCGAIDDVAELVAD